MARGSEETAVVREVAIAASPKTVWDFPSTRRR
jgi:hypothetical protein